jgi:hypothetical protein
VWASAGTPCNPCGVSFVAESARANAPGLPTLCARMPPSPPLQLQVRQRDRRVRLLLQGENVYSRPFKGHGGSLAGHQSAHNKHYATLLLRCTGTPLNPLHPCLHCRRPGTTPPRSRPRARSSGSAPSRPAAAPSVSSCCCSCCCCCNGCCFNCRRLLRGPCNCCLGCVHSRHQH